MDLERRAEMMAQHSLFSHLSRARAACARERRHGIAVAHHSGSDDSDKSPALLATETSRFRYGFDLPFHGAVFCLGVISPRRLDSIRPPNEQNPACLDLWAERRNPRASFPDFGQSLDGRSARHSLRLSHGVEDSC